MVYYDWNIDKFGFIWPGFLHSYIDKSTGKRTQYCAYIKHDLEDYGDAADDPEILSNTFFNDRARMLSKMPGNDDFLKPDWYNAWGDDPNIYMTMHITSKYHPTFYNEFRCTVVKLRPAWSTDSDAIGKSGYVDDTKDTTAYYMFTVYGAAISGVTEDGELLCDATNLDYWYKYLSFIDKYQAQFNQSGMNLYTACDATNFPIVRALLLPLWLAEPWQNPNAQVTLDVIANNPMRNYAKTEMLMYDATKKLYYFSKDNKKYYIYADYVDSAGLKSYYITNPVRQNKYGFFQIQRSPGNPNVSATNEPLTYDMTEITSNYADYELANRKHVAQHTDDITACESYVSNCEYLNLVETIQGTNVLIRYNYMGLNWYHESIFVKSIDIKPTVVDNRTVDEILQEALDNPQNPWKTPQEYYSDNSPTGQLPSGESGTGYVKARVVSKDEKDKMTVPTWWWSNTLANWCTFKKTEQYTTELFVWNGQNGWDKFSSIMLEPRFAGSSKIHYYYDITRFIKGARLRGRVVYDSLTYEYKSIKLIADTKFSQYDERNFQTVKLNKMYIAGKGTDRYPISVGIPTIMRLPSGELQLLYKLKVPGMSKNTEVIYDDNIDFVNAVCKAYFGDGQEKTIREDWKRFYKIVNSGEETATDIITDEDSSLVDADEINTIHENSDMFCISLTVPRQYPETGTSIGNDYVERWEK